MKIESQGCWTDNTWTGETGHWSINMSSILDQLIKSTVRYCDSHLSDMLITWNIDVEKNLSNPNWHSTTVLFGFRDNGVDHKAWIENNYKKPNYYNKILCLYIDIEDRHIKMTLTDKVNVKQILEGEENI